MVAPSSRFSKYDIKNNTKDDIQMCLFYENAICVKCAPCQHRNNLEDAKSFTTIEFPILIINKKELHNEILL